MSICKQDVVDLREAADEINYHVDANTRSSELLSEDERETLWAARKVLRDLANRIEKIVG